MLGKKTTSNHTQDQILLVTENSSSKWLQNTIEIRFHPNRKIWNVPLILSKRSLKFHRECFPLPDPFQLGLGLFKTDNTSTYINIFTLDHTTNSTATSYTHYSLAHLYYQYKILCTQRGTHFPFASIISYWVISGCFHLTLFKYLQGFSEEEHKKEEFSTSPIRKDHTDNRNCKAC